MKIELKYKDNLYVVQDDFPHEVSEKGEVPFIWEDGNFSCDCNRSLFIQQDCDPTFEELPCGEEIKLMRIFE